MNAIELAHELKRCIDDGSTDLVCVKESADMLLQQAKEIEQLKLRELSDEEYEKIMKQWDYWRKQIANGDKSSSPRDWFEGVIDDLLEKVSEK